MLRRYAGPMLEASLLGLTVPVKVPDYDISAIKSLSTKEDERATALARRAQQGDYDEGRKTSRLSYDMGMVFTIRT